MRYWASFFQPLFNVLSNRRGADTNIYYNDFLGAFLTGIGVYDKISRFAGAGSIAPITGFANSIVSPAVEYKKEGFVFGVGSKMFLIAGPVLVYGISASILICLVYYFV